MQLIRLLAVAAGLLALAGAARSGRVTSPAPLPVRLVSASISVDGQVVLRASTSDDGHPDADAVWGYLTRQLEFRPTEAFAALDLDRAQEAVTLGWIRGKENQHLGAPPKLQVDVDYCGRDAPFVLGLVEDAARGTWRVSPETVEKRFPYRLISRREAALLSDPRRKH